MRSHEGALAGRRDLEIYGGNARLLFALETRFHIADIHTVAADSLTDGPDDKKCDLIYVDREAGCAVIAQAYSASTPHRAAPSGKASDLNTAVTWLLTRPLPELPGHLQSAAAALRSALEDADVRTVQAWYVHNLQESPNVEDELRTVEQALKAAIETHFPKADVEEMLCVEVGLRTLEEWYAALEAPILVTKELQVAIPGGYTIKGDNWEAAVTSVPASWLHRLWKENGAQLFSANVRDYLGSRRSARNVNHNIKQTATESPERFWAYNNGVTALVNEFSMAGNVLTVTGLSIVNGAQTTGALGSLSEAPVDSAYVQARFVKCSDVKTVQRIIQYNNTQNVVKVTDFRSNDPTQRRLREEFDKIPLATYLGGRRGGAEDIIKRPGNLVATDTCSQALASFHQDPAVAYNQKSEIWENDRLYSKYFSEETTAQHIVFAFSLLRAVEERKRELMAKAARSSQEEQLLSFLRNRGATFMLCAAIASCVETFLGVAVPNKFRLSFGSVSPETAIKYWRPIVDATAPFSQQLEPAVRPSGLKNRDEIGRATSAFQAMVEATKQVNGQVFSDFRGNVIAGAA